MAFGRSLNLSTHKVSDKGVALIATVALMAILTTMGFALMALTDHSLRLADRQQRSALAFNIAESGVERAIQWLRSQSTPPGGTAALDIFGGWQTLGSGSYLVIVDPDDANPGQYLKSYIITCTAQAAGVRERIEVRVRQASFGRYAYFTDSEVSSVSGGAIWFVARDRLDGPVHSNNTSGSVFNINYVGATSPIFLDMVTGAGSYINYNPSAPSNETTFRLIYRDGSRGFRLGVDRVELPDSTTIQRDAAWGSSSGFPTSRGVYVRAANSGGIYVRDDCRIAMEVGSGGKQVVRITQKDPVTNLDVTTTVTLDRAARQTIVQRGADSPAVQNGMVNGVIYRTGNITSLQGEIADNLVVGSDIADRNAFTIATDVNNGKTITITNNLFYRTQPDRNQPHDGRLQSTSRHNGTSGPRRNH